MKINQPYITKAKTSAGIVPAKTRQDLILSAITTRKTLFFVC